MSDKLLNSVLNNTVCVNELIEWLENQNKNQLYQEITEFGCSQREFIIFFLKYIHEESSLTQEIQPSPVIVKTPQRGRNTSYRGKRGNYHHNRSYGNRSHDNWSHDNRSHDNRSHDNRSFGNRSYDDASKTSTPKKSGLSVNSSQCHSPISPIHATRSSFGQKHTPKASQLCLGDFVIQKKSSKKKKSPQVDTSHDTSQENLNVSRPAPASNSSKTRRKINPTPVNTSAKKDDQNSQNSFNFESFNESLKESEESFQAIEHETTKVEIEKKEFLTQMRQDNVLDLALEPDVELVTFKKELDILVNIYNAILDNNLVLNFLSELYFVISLTLVHNGHIEKENFFTSLHNCVYFGTSILVKQYKFLCTLDRPTLKLLHENTRLQNYCPQLVEFLNQCRQLKERKSELVKEEGKKSKNVSYIPEVDTKENFPSDPSFHKFRKQRDLFHEILKNWEEQHFHDGYNFYQRLSRKVFTLINMHNDPVNYAHLARLYKGQLLGTIVVKEEEFSEDQLQFLQKIPNMSANKLAQLRSRLVTKNSFGGGLSPEPSFPGLQEFYKDFLITASNPIFYKHVIDHFVAELAQLDETTFAPSDVEDREEEVEPRTHLQYVACLKSMKLLAKFLGLLESLAYKSNFIPTTKILTNQIEARKYVLPPIDVKARLNIAVKTRRLIVTVPWVVEYLSMLDFTALRLPYYNEIIEQLLSVYHKADTLSVTEEQVGFAVLMKCCLGWLFDRSNFPRELYFTVTLGNFYSKLKLLDEENQGEINQETNKIVPVDRLDLIDDSALYACCPYLGEIRILLNKDPVSYSHRSGSVKYIKPVSTMNVEKEDVLRKRLQANLQEAFLHGQPASVRKTIELVSERVASSSVKHIIHVIVPEEKEKALNEFIEIRCDLRAQHPRCNPDTDFQESSLAKAKELSEKYYKEVKDRTRLLINEMCNERCVTGIKTLLPDDPTSNNTPNPRVLLLTYITISIRLCEDRIDQWFQVHVNTGIFMKEFALHMNDKYLAAKFKPKKLSYFIPKTGRDAPPCPTDRDVLSPSKLLVKFTTFMASIYQKTNFTLENCYEIIDLTYDTFRYRRDVHTAAQYQAAKLLLDLAIIIAVHKPEYLSDKIFGDKFIAFYKEFTSRANRYGLFDTILSPRNAALMQKSSNQSKSWIALSDLVVRLLMSELIVASWFEGTALAVFRKTLSKKTTKNYIAFFKNISHKYKASSSEKAKFKHLIHWMVNFCSDDAFF